MHDCKLGLKLDLLLNDFLASLHLPQGFHFFQMNLLVKEIFLKRLAHSFVLTHCKDRIHT